MLDEWIKKNVVYIQNGVLFSLKNEIMLFAGKWMEIENIMFKRSKLGSKSQICMLCLVCGRYTYKLNVCIIHI
jgi:hypothetical protein